MNTNIKKIEDFQKTSEQEKKQLIKMKLRRRENLKNVNKLEGFTFNK